MHLVVGDKLPPFVGATCAGRFFSRDAQAGRPAVIVPLGGLETGEATNVLLGLQPAARVWRQAGIDVIALSPISPALTAALGGAPEALATVVVVAHGGGIECLAHDGKPGAVVIDRSGRIVELFLLSDPDRFGDHLAALGARLLGGAGGIRSATAPVLTIPNIVPLDLCAALIAHFEASPHEPGRMASVSGNKRDETVKHRRDIELTLGMPLHAEVMQILGDRVVPEIKKAFQKDVSHADRILLARYDETGGYFKRHRDDALAETAFREFAVSMHLNTHEYEGGAVRFPEYDDDSYRAPAGCAAVFSASVLHEVTPVTKGRRYVVLTFLSSRSAV